MYFSFAQNNLITNLDFVKLMLNVCNHDDVTEEKGLYDLQLFELQQYI